MKRVILDTNILLSMVLGGKIGDINDAWKAEKFLLVVSDEIVSEYFEVLQRPKFNLKSSTIAVVMGRIYRKAEFVLPQERIGGAQPDAKDYKFLEAAVAGRVDFIVSGDKHLLDLSNFRNIPILTGRVFLNQLKVT
jgi:putative PIN family toxin of toxin-antitoxin system